MEFFEVMAKQTSCRTGRRCSIRSCVVAASHVVCHAVLCHAVLYRAWAGLSHHGVVLTVCVKHQQLNFPAEAPEALVALGQACMAADPEARPSFDDIVDVLAPLRDFVVSSALHPMH